MSLPLLLFLSFVACPSQQLASGRPTCSARLHGPRT
uniref:Uncharacterized protein n=1 Tax=Arundo donax TaxID=35708 RepID=A0A0A9HM93_ARUDO